MRHPRLMLAVGVLVSGCASRSVHTCFSQTDCPEGQVCNLETNRCDVTGQDGAVHGPPTVPVPRKPINDTYMGSVHVPGSLRPVFVWESSTPRIASVIRKFFTSRL